MENVIKSLSFNTIWKIIGAIFLIELLSITTFSVPWVSGLYFIALAIAFLITCIKNLRLGLFIVLTELMIGSKGYLFFLDIGEFRLSFRLGLFLILFFVWLFTTFNLQSYLQRLKTDTLFQVFHLFLLFILFGIVNGVMRENELPRIFFDVNGYFYFGLFFIFYDVFRNTKFVQRIIETLFATTIWMGVKTIVVLYFFSHSKFFGFAIPFVYKWIRDTGVGEITFAGGGFWRIFFQSQIFELAVIFIGLSIISFAITQHEKFLSYLRFKRPLKYIGIIILAIVAVLISFSRSFWLGAVTGYISLAVFVIFIAHLSCKKYWEVFLTAFLTGIIGIGLMLGIANFPIPEPTGGFGADLLKDRLISLSGAALSSRWNLLPPLLDKVKENPIFGSGYGTTVTYQSEDPRIRTEENPGGWYTTDVFEWGYLDTVTEIGIIGLLVYLIFIFLIIKEGWGSLFSKNEWIPFISAGFLIGILVVMVTHGFSPYLNHPLGIGYILISLFTFKSLKEV